MFDTPATATDETAAEAMLPLPRGHLLLRPGATLTCVGPTTKSLVPASKASYLAHTAVANNLIHTLAKTHRKGVFKVINRRFPRCTRFRGRPDQRRVLADP